MLALLLGMAAMAPTVVRPPAPPLQMAPPALQMVPPPLQMAPPAPPVQTTPSLSPPNPASVMRLFSGDDYPMEAQRREEQGTVSYRATVGINGRVTRCDVAESSGSASLDAATCNIIQRRARFRAARDQHGKPTEDQFNGRIRWVLPEAEPTPFADLRQATIFTADAKGSIATCRYEGSASDSPEQVWCAEMRTTALEEIAEKKSPPMTGRELVFEQGLLIGGPESAQVIGRGAGQAIIWLTAFALTIDADGKIVGCIDAIGDLDADKVTLDCARDRKDEFAAKFPPLGADAADRSNRHAVRYLASYTRPQR